MAYTTIDKPSDYFNTVTWTGDGSSSRDITGVGFQPDWVWGKCRNTTVSHALYDSVRGGSKLINSNATSVEGTNAALSAFVSDGFSVNSDSYFNANSNTYVAWNWLAGGSASSNSDGSITSTVSANTTAGFSIVKFVNNTSSTANTFGHGLGAVPQVIIMRSLDDPYNWDFHHHDIPISQRLVLNSTGAKSTSTYMNSTSPTNQVFTVKSDEFGSGSDCIAYCFADTGNKFFKAGSYTGNGNADGTFVYTGFKPAMVIMKKTSGADDWALFDNKRDVDNVTEHLIRPNSSAAEEVHANFKMDLLSNGFKLKTTDGKMNGSGATYIYMCFSENPFVTSTGIPTTAR